MPLDISPTFTSSGGGPGPGPGGFRPALIDPQGSKLGDATVVVTQSQAVTTPGASVWFDASQIVGLAVSEVVLPITADDPSVHELTYYWDFDDDGGNFTSPLQTPTAWKNRNIGRHKSTCYGWTTPGTKIVTLLIIDANKNWARVTVIVNVVADTSAYVGPRTILVDPLGIGDSSNYPSSQVFTTIPDAVAAYEALTDTGCVLLKRGETYLLTAQININNNFNNWHLGAWGTGTPPKIMRARNNSGSLYAFSYSNGTAILSNFWGEIEFEGYWDTETETGDPRFNPISHTLMNAGTWYATFYRVKMRKIQAFRPWNGNNITMRVAVIDCDISNWQDYGIHLSASNSIYSPNKWFALIGTAIHQALNACRGGYGKGHRLGAHHGPFRYVDAMKCIIHACSFYSGNSWPSGIQPCLRLAQGGNGSPTGGYRLYCSNIVALTGQIGVDGQNSSAPSIPGNHIVENFIIANCYGNDAFIGIGYGGTTFRNGLLVRRDQVKDISSGIILDLIQHKSQQGNSTARVDVDSVLLVNMASDTDYTDVVEVDIPRGDTEVFVNKRINISKHEPNIDPANTPHAPIDILDGFPEITRYLPQKRLGHNKDAQPVAATADGATLTLAYPPGLTLADVIVNGLHGLSFNVSDFFYNDSDDMTFVFNAGDIQVTNNTGGAWPAGDVQLAIHCTDNFLNRPGFEPVTTFIPAGRAQANSDLIDANAPRASYRDMLDKLRDSSPDDSPYEGAAP